VKREVESRISKAIDILRKESRHSAIGMGACNRLFLVVTCLGLLCGSALCRNQQRDGSGSGAGGRTAGSLKRPVTVIDSIQMTRLGDASYTNGGPSKGIVAKFSPDGKYFVVILRSGDLKTNTNVYSLVLFQTAEVFESPKPQVLISLASSSNRPAIRNVLWQNDNDTILFLGEHPGEQTQLYSLQVSSRRLTKLTSHPSNLTSFVMTANGQITIYASENPTVPFLTANVARTGLAVSGESLTDLIRGSFGGPASEDRSLWIKRLMDPSETKIVTQGKIMDESLEPSLSPDGAHLIVRTEATHVQSSWSEYEVDDQFLKPYVSHPITDGARTNIDEYELVDTMTGTGSVLTDTPIPSLGGEVIWSLDSKSVVVSNVLLPLDAADPAERARRRAHTFLVEFKIPSREFVVISQEDLRLVGWDSNTGVLICDVGRVDSYSGKATSRAYFRKGGRVWTRSGALEQITRQSLPDIVLEESMNSPPRIVAVDASTGRSCVLMVLNPQFENLALARVEEIEWQDSRGVEIKGGLYWPPEYVPGKKYPLILQTHAWDSHRFWMDGPWPTAFAAQALAAKGFFVVQAPDPDWHVLGTSREAPTAMAAYDGAIDYLEHRGLVDPHRVGIIGFSRTYWYVTYTLTHSRHRFAAATLADGNDGSYFQYMAIPGFAPGYEVVFGGPPYGKAMSEWLTQSPAFLMDKVNAPLRIQTFYPDSLLIDWHWFSGLNRLGRPVEMIYIPDGTHILEKPWDLLVSEQGDVDWFCFWIKDEEDPDPGKAEQYKRWQKLRDMGERTVSPVSTR